jgi:hypothetical protein
MGQVYANARSTLVWLGCDPDNLAASAFDLILETNQYFGEMLAKSNDRFDDMPQFTEPYPICMRQDRWSGVATLFDHVWFERVWTVQEVAVAEECRMFWGPVSIPFADVLEICVWFSWKPDFYNILWKFTRKIKRLGVLRISMYIQYHSTHNDLMPTSWQQARPGLNTLATRENRFKSFVSILQAARELKTTDPRDCVYAFLGCPYAKDNQGQTLVDADYTISLSKLSLDLACALLKHPSERHWVLSAVGHKHRSGSFDTAYPSWVPKWHAESAVNPHDGSPRYWYRTGGSLSLFAPDTSLSHLTISGSVFDKVVWMTPVIDGNNFRLNSRWQDPMNPESEELFIESLWKGLTASATRLCLSLKEDDYTRTLMAGYPSNRSRDSVPDSSHQDYVEAYKRMARLERLGTFRREDINADELQWAIRFEDLLQFLNESMLFITEHGRIGNAPNGKVVEIGDECCIIFGLSVPFLLTPAHNGRHKLVNECYIHGVMDGELMEQLTDSDLRDMKIVLE